MGTGDRDRAVVAACHDAEHHTALNGRDALLLCGNQLGVILLDGGGVDDQLSALDILRLMTHVYGNTVAADAVERLALVAVGAREDEALAVQNLCQRTHARAADADEVDAFDII